MNTREKFLRHIDALTKQSISMRAIAKKAGMDYTRLRNVYYASVKTDATEWELKQLEKAYRSELLLDYTEEERGLIEELTNLDFFYTTDVTEVCKQFVSCTYLRVVSVIFKETLNCFPVYSAVFLNSIHARTCLFYEISK